MLAQHLDHEPALGLVRPVLNAHIASINSRVSSASISHAALEDRLQCPIVQLACKAVSRGGGTGGVEGIVDEERSRVECEGGICCL